MIRNTKARARRRKDLFGDRPGRRPIRLCEVDHPQWSTTKGTAAPIRMNKIPKKQSLNRRVPINSEETSLALRSCTNKFRRNSVSALEAVHCQASTKMGRKGPLFLKTSRQGSRNVPAKCGERIRPQTHMACKARLRWMTPTATSLQLAPITGAL